MSQNETTNFRCGYVAIVGRPSVGKSTLINRLIGQKISITSEKVQTTRQRVRGILTLENKAQLIFLDTPGFSKALDSLGEFLTDEAQRALQDADVIIMVVDGSTKAGKGDAWLAQQVCQSRKPALLVVNKIDRLNSNQTQTQTVQTYLDLFSAPPSQPPQEQQELPPVTIPWISVSAKTGRRIGKIAELLIPHIPHGEALYDPDIPTDQHLRQIAAETIREKAMRLLSDELPHAVAILIESFDESDPTLTRIVATLYVDKKSQKGMVIGAGGQMIKQIGQQARQDLETLMEHQVFLDLHVKVKENWRKDALFLKSIGLA